jgi:hypothetical protein
MLDRARPGCQAPRAAVWHGYGIDPHERGRRAQTNVLSCAQITDSGTRGLRAIQTGRWFS